MKKYLVIAVVALLGVNLAVPITTDRAFADTAAETAAVRDAVGQWFAALNAMFAGDPKPFAALYSHADDVTYMGAEGTYRIGWEAVYADWQTQAAKSLGGEVHGVEIHIVVEGDMATATHFTKGKITTADDKVIDQQVRETSVFRKEDGVWKMIGHQADNYPVWVKVVD